MADHKIAKELKASQSAFEQIAGMRERRAIAVKAAISAGWPVGRIARVMDVDPTSVRAILTAAQKQEPKP